LHKLDFFNFLLQEVEMQGSKSNQKKQETNKTRSFMRLVRDSSDQAEIAALSECLESPGCMISG
jgi:hypothetical protein